MQTKLSYLTPTTPDMEVYLQEPEKLIRENLILSRTGKNTVTTTDIILFFNGEKWRSQHALPEENQNNLRCSKSVGNWLYEADPMKAENSQQRIKRVIREGKRS